jgi:hypothetical protein
MRVTSLAIWVMPLLDCSAVAQTAPSSPTDTPAPSVSRSIRPPNGLTEADAKARFEARGYSNVRGLHRDAFGIWHATATKSSKTVQVGLDFAGEVGIE